MTEENAKPEDEKKPEGNEPVQLPDDHPLVKSLAAIKEQVKELKASNSANADKAKRLDELEEASKSDLEKERARAEKAEKALADRNAKDEQAKVRDDVAKAKGVPASALRGSSKEDFEEHADELIAAGIKVTSAPSADGQGDTGKTVTEGKEKSAEEILDAVYS